MRWLAVLVLTVSLAGCGGSEGDRSGSPTTSSKPARHGQPAARRQTPTNPDTTAAQPPDTTAGQPPTDYDALLARLPPLDVPASREVAVFRKAAFESFFGRCVSREGGVDKRSRVKANLALLASLPVFPGARFVNEFSSDEYDFNGCSEGLGPPTNVATSRNYRLPSTTRGRAVVRFYERSLTEWERTFASEGCEQSFTQGDASLHVAACGNSLSLDARAAKLRRPPEPPPLPPRPTGKQYPPTPDDPTTPDPEPTEYSVEPGTTCERGQASGPKGVVPIILPPPPGITASIDNKPYKLGARTFKASVVVEWSLGTVHGDCPPSELILSYPAVTAFTIHEPVHARSGMARMPLLDFVPRPKLLRATAVSVDGLYSRQAAVLISP